MPPIRKRGLEVAPGITLRSSESPDGRWVAWIEKNGKPVEVEENKPRLFEGPTCYQAQCRAMKWLRGQDSTRIRIQRARTASG